MKKIIIAGAGLAGAEAAWQLARLGIAVELQDIKPGRMTAAHKSVLPAELVCSNSLKSEDPKTASGLLKREMRQLDSLILKAADSCRVPAGSALAVDRTAFSQQIKKLLDSTGLISWREAELTELSSPDDTLTIIATGPLTTDALMAAMAKEWGDMLHFFDAAAPIVSEESLDPNFYFAASRYGRGSDDYLNCPLDKELYLSFREALLAADKVSIAEFDRKVFQHCQPLEILAERGEDTMRFGPLRPVGLIDPKSGKTPYAVLQLRKEQSSGEMYGLVGCQTRLTFQAQREVFGIIPALREAEYYRYGVMHRNHYIRGPKILDFGQRIKGIDNIFMAGQITGVEGYMESAASGLITARIAALIAAGMPPERIEQISLPKTTVLGALTDYAINSDSKDYQPMNANFGLLQYDERFKAKRKKERKEQAVLMSDHFIRQWLSLYQSFCREYGLIL